MERTHVVDDLTIKYEGLFDFKKIYELIDTWFQEAGYDKVEKENYEKNTPKGKYIELELRPYKKMTDYAKFEIRVLVKTSNMVQKKIEIDGKKRTFDYGKVEIVFNSYIFADYEERWEGKAIWQLIRTIFEKYVYKSRDTQMESLLRKETKEVYDEIKAFLNLKRYE